MAKEGDWKKSGGGDGAPIVGNVVAHRAKLSTRIETIRSAMSEANLVAQPERTYLEFLFSGYPKLEFLGQTTGLQFQHIQVFSVDPRQIDPDNAPTEAWEDWLRERHMEVPSVDSQGNKIEPTQMSIVRGSIANTRIPGWHERLAVKDQQYTEYAGLLAIRYPMPAQVSVTDDNSHGHLFVIEGGVSKEELAAIKAAVAEVATNVTTLTIVDDNVIMFQSSTSTCNELARRMPQVSLVDRIPDQSAIIQHVDGHPGAIPVVGQPGPPSSGVTIGVIDAGFEPRNPWLQPVLLGAYDPLMYGTTSSDANHGTAVAGQAAYYKLFDGSGAPPVVHGIHGFKVLHRPAQKSFELAQILAYARAKVPDLAIFNFSANSEVYQPWHGAYTKSEYLVDKLLHAEPMIFLANTAGNWNGNPSVNPNQHTNPGPNQAWITPPGRLANSAVVGSLALRSPPGAISRSNEPSYFTRVGQQVARYPQKPDLVHDGGNRRVSARGFVSDSTVSPRMLSGATPNPTNPLDAANFTALPGTSFAAPLVAYLGAYLRHLEPDWTANTLRALIADSCHLPNPSRNPSRLSGVGIPRDRLIFQAADDQVSTVIQSQIGVMDEVIFDLPTPPSVVSLGHERMISVSLAYNPPVKWNPSTSPMLVNVACQLVAPDGEVLKPTTKWHWDSRQPYTLRKALFRIPGGEDFVSSRNQPWQLRIRARRVGAIGSQIPRTQQQLFSAVVSYHAEGVNTLRTEIRQRIRERIQERIRPRN